MPRIYARNELQSFAFVVDCLSFSTADVAAVMSVKPEVLRRILVAVDDSEASSQAVSWTQRNFLRPHDVVFILTVYKVESVGYQGASPISQTITVSDI